MSAVMIPPWTQAEAGVMFSVRPALDLAARKSESEGERAVSALASALDVHPRQVYRWFHRGLTAVQADAVAVVLGYHPCEVWPDWWSSVEWEDDPAA